MKRFMKSSLPAPAGAHRRVPARSRACLLLLAALGCTDPSEPTAAPASAPASALASAPVSAPPSAPASAPAPSLQEDPTDAGGARNGSGGGQGTGGGRFRQAAVYLDGTALAVLKYGELPPTLATTWQERTTSEGGVIRVRRFAVADYITALGIDRARVREVHFYGGRQRIGILPGAELVKSPKDITFSFTQSEGGKPRMHWPKESTVTDKIDMVNDMAIYVDKVPPTWNTETWRLELGGQPVEGIAYRTQEVGGGTRLYVDGRLARMIKPKTLGPGSGDPPRWSLPAQLASAGVVLGQVQGIDLVNHDVVGRRVAAGDVAGLTFEATQNANGRITVLPGEVVAEAVLVYVQAKPPEDRGPVADPPGDNRHHGEPRPGDNRPR